MAGRIDNVDKIDNIDKFESISKIENNDKIDNMDQSPSSVGQVLVKFWSTVGQVLVKCWSSVGHRLVISAMWIKSIISIISKVSIKSKI